MVVLKAVCCLADSMKIPGGGGVLPYMGYTGTCRWIGYGFWPFSSALNRVYNFERVCPGPVLDRVWSQDCRRVFGNPKSETLLCIYFSEQCFTSIDFPLKVHRC